MSQTVFGTKEWAPQSANIVEGCSNNCKYCYAREMAVRFGRKKPNEWENEVYREDWAQKNYLPRNGRIMFPSTHDITPTNLNESVAFLKRLLLQGNSILIVTKPSLSCIHKLCHELSSYKDQILFRFTIGSVQDSVLSYWEPGAPCFDERFQSLKLAYNRGFSTSISCEPILDDDPSEIIETLLPYITDAIWMGKPNALIRRLKMNGYQDKSTIVSAINLMNSLTDEMIYDLFIRYGDNPKIKWKESIKKVLDLTIPEEVGLDI